MTSIEEIKAKINRLGEEYGKGNFDIIDEVFSHNVIIHMAPNPDMNIERYKQLVRRVRSTFPDMQFVSSEIIVEGDRSALRYTAQGTHKGKFMGIAPTDKQLTWTGAEVMHWEGGKIVEGWWYADTLGMMQQLGVSPTQ